MLNNNMWAKYQVKINFNNKTQDIDFKCLADVDEIFISKDKMYLFRDRGPNVSLSSENIKNIEITIR